MTRAGDRARRFAFFSLSLPQPVMDDLVDVVEQNRSRGKAGVAAAVAARLRLRWGFNPAQAEREARDVADTLL